MSRRPSTLRYAHALATLVTASLAGRFLPFRNAAAWATRRRATDRPAPFDQIAECRRMLEAWSRRLWWRTACLEQGLAAAHLLSRRDYAVTLLYGAAMVEGELKAHVWVRSGDRDVIGCENAGDFAILSQFSNGPPSSPVHS